MCSSQLSKLYVIAYSGYRNSGVSADPTTVVCDFETAAMNADHAVLGPHRAVSGIFVRVSDAKSRKLYIQHDETCRFCGMLDAHGVPAV